MTKPSGHTIDLSGPVDQILSDMLHAQMATSLIVLKALEDFVVTDRGSVLRALEQSRDAAKPGAAAILDFMARNMREHLATVGEGAGDSPVN